MLRLRVVRFYVALGVVCVGLAVLSALAAGATQTFTGKVSDTMCGAEHQEGVPPAECVRTCVRSGAKYALVVGDKVYTLFTSDPAAKDELSKLAWQQATVTGTPDEDTIAVHSVTAAK